MSNREEREAEDNYEAENDDAAPVSADVVDNSYVDVETNPAARNEVPVQPDQADYEDPMQPPYSNTDQQLGTYSTSGNMKLLSD
jgi:hypothetical protein